MFPPLPHVLAVAAGAVLGAWLRWGLALMLNRPTWPWGTLTANLVGGLLAGLLWAGMEGHPSLASWLRPLVMMGFLGALTTFSTFSLETVLLLQAGAGPKALAYAGASLLGSLVLTGGGLALGMALWG